MAGSKKDQKLGAIGTALAWFREHHAPHRNELNNALRLLKQSSVFLKMAKDINKSYVAFQTAEKTKNWFDAWKQDDFGVLKAGRYKGRRVFMIYPADKGQGSHFLPYESVDNRLPNDFVIISVLRKRRPSAEDLGEVQAHYLGRLVHELAHAHNRIDNSGPLALDDYADGIKAFVQDEIEARRKEKNTLRQIQGFLRGVKKKDSKTQEVFDRINWRLRNLKTDEASVQRDFIEGRERLTYLEKGVLQVLMTQQTNWEALTWGKIQALNRYVARLKLGRPLEVFLDTEFPQDHVHDPKSKTVPGSAGPYVDLRLIRRVMQERWKEREVDGSSKAKAKETVLQEHARAFFPPDITYAEP